MQDIYLERGSISITFVKIKSCCSQIKSP